MGPDLAPRRSSRPAVVLTLTLTLTLTLIVVWEASHDGVEWEEYHFRYKPGDPKACPILVQLGHMPRLDWRLHIQLGLGLGLGSRLGLGLGFGLEAARPTAHPTALSPSPRE